jgi:hypothetical protein
MLFRCRHLHDSGLFLMRNIVFLFAVLAWGITACGSSPAPAPTSDASVADGGSDGGSEAAACLPKGASCAANGGYEPALCCSLDCAIPNCK